MKTMKLGLEFAVIFIFLSLAAVPSDASKIYQNFQALGFGIFTGSAPAILGINETCVAETSKDATHSNCASGVAIDDPYSGRKLCLECLITNPECECSVDDMTCQQHTGVLDSFEASCYLGKDNVTQDVMGRVSIMQAAVERAYQLADPSANTLKIFNAPEFYFRGRRGQYPASSIHASDTEFNALDQIGLALDGIVQQKRFADWLFVFGTVVAGEQVVESNKERQQRNVYFNFAPVFRGFDPTTTSSTGMRLLVPKRYISTIDFLTDARFSSERLVPNPIDDDDDKLYDNALWNLLKERLAGGFHNGEFVQGDGRKFVLVENAWFVMDNVTFSLEVCVDFAQGFARDSFTLLSASRGSVTIPSVGGGRLEHVAVPSSMAQVSIVTSAGINVTAFPHRFVVTSGGSLFVQDGLRPHEPQLQTRAVDKRKDGSLAYSDASHAKAVFESFNVYPTKDEAKAAVEGLYSIAKSAQPQIHVFPPRPIVQVQVNSGVHSSSHSSVRNNECSDG